ncbi:MAG: sigma-70 family RNA polymerase sigma factor [Candidatus Dormibacteria bacterium]
MAAPASRMREAEVAFRKYGPAVQRYCASRLRAPDLAEDAVQETFLRFMRRAEEDVDNPEAWLIRAADYSCRNLSVRASRDSMTGLIPTDAAPGPSPEDAALDRALLERLLRGVHPSQARILAQMHLFGWTSREIGEQLGLSAGNVWIIALRAKRQIRELAEAIGARVGIWAGLHMLSRLGRWLRSRYPAGAQEFLGLAPATWFQVGVVTALAIGLSSGISGPWFNSATATQHVQADVSAFSGGVAGFTRQASYPPKPSQAAGTAAGAASYSPAQIVGEAVLPQNHGPTDSAIEGVAISPTYGSDHTILAAGTQLTGCSRACASLYRSSDGGTSWSALGAQGLLGTRIIVPPDFDASGELLSVSGAGLQRSTDSGRTFVTTLPNVSAADVDPASPVTRVALGTQPITWYFTGSGSVQPGGMLPEPLETVDDVRVADRTGTVLVVGRGLGYSLGQRPHSSVFICDAASTCVAGAQLPGTEALHFVDPQLTFGQSLLILGGASTLAVSRDGGRTFQEIGRPSGLTLQSEAVAVDGSAPRLIVSASSGLGGGYGLLLGGPPQGPLRVLLSTGMGPTDRVDALGQTPDGRLLAGTSGPAGGGGGIYCSMDYGINWFNLC